MSVIKAKRTSNFSRRFVVSALFAMPIAPIFTRILEVQSEESQNALEHRPRTGLVEIIYKGNIKRISPVDFAPTRFA